MIIIYILALAALGALIGIATGLILQSSSFNMGIHVISGILGSAIAGYFIPDTNVITPPLLEQLLRGLVGAIAVIFSISLLRKV